MNDIYKTNFQDVDQYLNKQFYMLYNLDSSKQPEACKIKLLSSPTSSIAYTIYNTQDKSYLGTILINEFKRLLVCIEDGILQIPYHASKMFISNNDYALYKNMHIKLVDNYINDAILELEEQLRILKLKKVQLLPE